MPRILKLAAIALAALLAALAGVAGLVAATFDPDHYKAAAIELVKQKTHRTLAIPGRISLRLLPTIGADIGKFTLSEPGTSAPFLAVDHAQVSLAVLPLLLDKEVVIDQVDLAGLRATLVRYPEGHMNVDDLLATREDKRARLRLAVDDLRIAGASVQLDDRKAGRKVQLRQLDLASDAVKDGVPGHIALSARVTVDRPALDASVAFETGFTIDSANARFVLRGLDASLRGSYAGYDKVDLAASGNADLRLADTLFSFDALAIAASASDGGRTLAARIDVPRLAVTEHDVSGGKLTGHASAGEGARTVRAEFSLPAFTGTRHTLVVPALLLDLALKDGAIDASAHLSGALEADLDHMLLTSANLEMGVAGTSARTRIGGTLSASMKADLRARSIDLVGIRAALTLPNPRGGAMELGGLGDIGIDLAGARIGGAFNGKLDDSAVDVRLAMRGFDQPAYEFSLAIDRIDLDRYRARPAAGAARPLDLSALKPLRAAGKLRIGSLTAAGVSATNVAIDLRSAHDKLVLAPMAATLYGGSTRGALTLDFTLGASTPHMTLVQEFTGIRLGALLGDAIGAIPIDGSGDVALELDTHGASTSQLRRGLAGMARFRLVDGSLGGFDLARIAHDAKAVAGSGGSAERTGFTRLAATFRITDGVARNDDLMASSPLLRLAGAGTVDIAAGTLAYLARCTVPAALPGQDVPGPRAATVAVRLSGPLDAPRWQVDRAAVAADGARRAAAQQPENLPGAASEP